MLPYIAFTAILIGTSTGQLTTINATIAAWDNWTTHPCLVHFTCLYFVLWLPTFLTFINPHTSLIWLSVVVTTTRYALLHLLDVFTFIFKNSLYFQLTNFFSLVLLPLSTLFINIWRLCFSSCRKNERNANVVENKRRKLGYYF